MENPDDAIVVETRREDLMDQPCQSPEQSDLRRLSDSALLSAVLRREERAWRELSRRYRPLVYRCVARVLRRHDPGGSAEDLNEVCGDLWYSLLRDDMHKLRCFDPARGARLSSWLGLLSINAACDFLRQSGFTKVKNMKGGILLWSDKVDPSVPKY